MLLVRTELVYLPLKVLVEAVRVLEEAKAAREEKVALEEAKAELVSQRRKPFQML